MNDTSAPDLILENAKITTLDRAKPEATSLVVKNGRIVGVDDSGYTKDTPNPPAGEIQRDGNGNPTGLLIARPNAGILYATVGKQPKLPPEQQMNSSRHFMRELNRLGLTSLVDAGGGSQIYPDDYAIIEELHKR